MVFLAINGCCCWKSSSCWNSRYHKHRGFFISTFLSDLQMSFDLHGYPEEGNGKNILPLVCSHLSYSFCSFLLAKRDKITYQWLTKTQLCVGDRHGHCLSALVSNKRVAVYSLLHGNTFSFSNFTFSYDSDFFHLKQLLVARPVVIAQCHSILIYQLECITQRYPTIYSVQIHLPHGFYY